MSTSVASAAGGEKVPSNTYYIVLDEDDRIVQVSPGLHEELGRWLGQVLWDHLPEAADVYGTYFEDARSTGRTVESIVYYAGRVKRLTAIPAPDGLVVHVERLAELDVRTLGTLTASLRRIEALLAGPASEQLDPPARASLQALP